jgi:hypothetical protein
MGAANVASRVPPRPGRGGPAPAEQASRLPAVLGPERVAGLADQARVRFYAAA